jgi:hypothetical protein
MYKPKPEKSTKAKAEDSKPIVQNQKIEVQVDREAEEIAKSKPEKVTEESAQDESGKSLKKEIKKVLTGGEAVSFSELYAQLSKRKVEGESSSDEKSMKKLKLQIFDALLKSDCILLVK